MPEPDGDRVGGAPDPPPAGPDSVARFNALGALVLTPILVVFGVIYLIDRLTQHGNPIAPIALIVVGLGALPFVIRQALRHRVRRDGTTLDEHDPRRTPEQQRRRDDRVRAQNAQLSTRQEVWLGIGLIPLAVVLFVIPVLLGRAPDAGDLFLSVALVILGVGLLIHAAIVALRRRSRVSP